MSINYFVCQTVFLVWLSGVDIPSFLHRLYCRLWLADYHIIPHYLVKGRDVGGKVTEHKMRVLILLTISSEILLILKITQEIL
jgi:hypothetical protein